MGNPRNEKGWPKPQLAIPAPPSRAVRVITTRLALSMVGESNDPILALMRHLDLPVTRQDYLTLAHLGRPPKQLSAHHG